MVNNVIGVVNYVIAAAASLLNFVIADRLGGEHRHQLRTEAAQMHKFRTYHSNRVRPWLVAPIGG